MNTDIQNEVKSLLNKYRSGIISPEEFKTLTSDMNQLSDAELKNPFYEEWDNFTNYEPLSQDKINALYPRPEKKSRISPFIKAKKILVANSSFYTFSSRLRNYDLILCTKSGYEIPCRTEYRNKLWRIRYFTGYITRWKLGSPECEIIAFV